MNRSRRYSVLTTHMCHSFPTLTCVMTTRLLTSGIIVPSVWKTLIKLSDTGQTSSHPTSFVSSRLVTVAFLTVSSLLSFLPLLSCSSTPLLPFCTSTDQKRQIVSAHPPCNSKCSRCHSGLLYPPNLTRKNLVFFIPNTSSIHSTSKASSSVMS